MIEVRVNEAQLRSVQDRLDYIANGAVKALYRALNKTASKAKTESSKEIRKQVRLTAAYIKENIKGPADGYAYRANSVKLLAKISAPKRGLRLDKFLVSAPPARAGRPSTPIKVKVKPTGASQSITSAFFVPAKGSGGYLIAVRNAVLLANPGMKTKVSGGAAGYTVLSGPSLSQVFAKVKDALSAPMSEYLAKSLESETAWLIRKNPPPGGDGSGDE